MTVTRRKFVNTCGQIGVAAAVAPLLPFNKRLEAMPTIQDSRHRNLVEASLAAAKSAGADYADVRLTFTDELLAGQANPRRSQSMTFGVRALVSGFWGFASSPVWDVDEAARLGRSAVQQARVNVIGNPREVELAPVPDSADRTGHWAMPVKDDPFQLHYDEIYDFIQALHIYLGGLANEKYLTRQRMISCVFVRQDKAFGSTSGQFLTQRIYNTRGGIGFQVQSRADDSTVPVSIEQISGAGLGFEYWRDQPLRDYIREAFEDAIEQLLLPIKPVDVGRFNTLISQAGIASLLSQTIGASTEIDRALGYEANAGTTSYITEPTEMIGNLKVGSSLLSVTADRSEPGAIGTVKWDDEGITPHQFDLVRDGVLSDMQTNREGAGWLRSVYEASNKPFVSHGCAYAPDAIYAPMIHSANLSMAPGANSGDTLETLREGMDEGIEFHRPQFNMDQQQMTGLLTGVCFEIKNGKRVARYADAGVLFRTSEMWNGIIALGGSDSVRKYGHGSSKGQPSQVSYHGASAPPAIIKELTVVDVKRKA